MQVQAYEVEPRSNKAGPCLLQLKGVSAKPAEFLKWLESSILERYVLRVYWLDPANRPAASEEDLLEILKNLEPPSGVIRLQCNPKHLERCLQDQLPVSWKLDPKHFDHVLSIVQCNRKLHWHLHSADTLYKNPHAHIPLDSASSAMHKLDEAFKLGGVNVDGLNLAIDLGAAPGGWTMLLARKMRLVLAVDAAELSPEALRPRNVVHIKLLAQHATADILRHSKGELADLLVSDMNMHINEAIKPVKALVGLLKPGAWLIITLKYFGVGREQRRWEPIIAEELAAYGFHSCKFIWSLANTVHERTLIAQKSANSNRSGALGPALTDNAT